MKLYSPNTWEQRKKNAEKAQEYTRVNDSLITVNAGVPSARPTLATGTPSASISRLRCDARTPVAVWHFAVVPGRRLPSCRRCSRATTTFHSEPNMRCDADISTFGDRAFAAAVPGLWNSLPSQLKEADLSYNGFRHFCLDSSATVQCELF